MATPYEKIFNYFYKSLVGDTKFFNYKDLTVEEVAELVNDHSLSLLKKSIAQIYSFGVPQIELNSYDDVLEQINADLNEKELDLIAMGMYYFYAREDYNKLKSMGTIFKNSELNVFSPANERDSIKNLIKEFKEEQEYNISSYLNRDRTTGKLKLIK